MLIKCIIVLLILKSCYCGEYLKKCKNDIDCNKVSKSYICKKQICRHIPIQFDNKIYIIGLAIILIINFLSSIAGMGSGTLIVPVLWVLFNFNIKHAIPLSKLIIFVSAILNSYFIIKKSRSDEYKIDFNILVYSIPFLLLGTIIGVIFNHLLPELIIQTILLMVLLFSSIMILKNYIKILKNNDKTHIKENLELDDLDYVDLKFENKININPNKCTIINLFCLFIILFFTFLGYKFFNITLISILISLLISIFCCIYKFKITKEFTKKDYILSWSNFVSGIASGTLGLGGSTLLIPTLLHLNYTPLITSGITGYSILFSSSSTTFQYYLLGAIDINMILKFLLFALSGTFLGRIFIKIFFKKSKKRNFIIFIIFILYVTSFIVILVDLVKLINKN